MMRSVPLEKLLLETDAPFFVPRIVGFPQRGSDGYAHPGFVFAVAEQVAQMKGVTLEECVVNTRANVKRVYGF